jgi:hypothetical protein
MINHRRIITNTLAGTRMKGYNITSEPPDQTEFSQSGKCCYGLFCHAFQVIQAPKIAHITG